MSRRVQENVVISVFLVIFIGVVVLSLDFGPRARLIPLPLASFGVILALIQLVWQNLGSTDALKMDMIRVQASNGAQSATSSVSAVSAVSAVPEESLNAQRSPAAQKPPLRRRVGAYGMVMALLAMLLAFGPLPAVFAFTLGYFLVTRYYTGLMAVVYASLFTGAIHVLFFVLLQVNPYHGLLAPLIARFE